MHSLNLFAVFGLGPMEFVIVGAVALLLFGNRLPSAMRSMGQGLREFQSGLRGVTKEIEEGAP